MQNADLVHFTTAVDTFHESEQRQNESQELYIEMLRSGGPLDVHTVQSQITTLDRKEEGEEEEEEEHLQFRVERVVLLFLELVFVDGPVGGKGGEYIWFSEDLSKIICKSYIDFSSLTSWLLRKTKLILFSPA